MSLLGNACTVHVCAHCQFKWVALISLLHSQFKQVVLSSLLHYQFKQVTSSSLLHYWLKAHTLYIDSNTWHTFCVPNLPKANSRGLASIVVFTSKKIDDNFLCHWTYAAAMTTTDKNFMYLDIGVVNLRILPGKY
jgi:hypothetical protein